MADTYYKEIKPYKYLFILTLVVDVIIIIIVKILDPHSPISFLAVISSIVLLSSIVYLFRFRKNFYSKALISKNNIILTLNKKDIHIELSKLIFTLDIFRNGEAGITIAGYPGAFSPPGSQFNINEYSMNYKTKQILKNRLFCVDEIEKIDFSLYEFSNYGQLMKEISILNPNVITDYTLKTLKTSRP